MEKERSELRKKYICEESVRRGTGVTGFTVRILSVLFKSATGKSDLAILGLNFHWAGRGQALSIIFLG